MTKEQFETLESGIIILGEFTAVGKLLCGLVEGNMAGKI